MAFYIDTFNIYNLVIYSVVFLFLLIASISDLKKREVPDWLNYGAIITGIGLNLIFTIAAIDFSYITNSLLGFGLLFIVAYVLFYTGQWGGGDSKAIMALGALLGFEMKGKLPFIALLILSIAIVGALYGILWSALLAIKNRKKFVSEFKKLSLGPKFFWSRIIIVVIIILTAVLQLLNIENNLKIVSLGFALAIALTLLIYSFITAVEKSCMHKLLPPIKLTEGDWINKEIILGKKILFKSRGKKLSHNDVNKIKKEISNIDFYIKVKRNFLFIFGKILTTKLSKVKKGDAVLANIKAGNLCIKKGAKINSQIYDNIALYFKLNSFPNVKVSRKFLFFKITANIAPYNVKNGDLLLEDIVKQKYVCGPTDLGISKAQIELLKKLRIRSVLVKEGIPFIPSFLLAFLMAIFLGDNLASVLFRGFL